MSILHAMLKLRDYFDQSKTRVRVEVRNFDEDIDFEVELTVFKDNKVYPFWCDAVEFNDPEPLVEYIIGKVEK